MVVFGRQGAGKGTQCVRLSEHYGIPHISTGDMLRSAVEAGTEFGLRAKKIMDAGDLVPDDVMVGVVSERLADDDTVKGFLLDGFPRTRNQAETLEQITAGRGGIDLAVNLEVPEEVVMERMLARGRADDTEEAIRRRLDLYEAETSPLLAWYESSGRLVSVDGVGTEEEITARLISAIDAFHQR